MFTFLHAYHPSPILISIGPINIYWYGFFIVLGIVAAFLVTLKLLGSLAPKWELSSQKEIIFDLAFWLVIWGLIGARVYHVLLEWQYYLARPLNIFKIWQGGLAIHGGIIAGVVVIWVFAGKIQKQNCHPELDSGSRENCDNPESSSHSWIPGQARNDKIASFWLLAAIIAPGLALAQAIGRWGNYFNQELFGRPTNLPWGIPIDIINRPIEYISAEYFHPTFLYESIGNLLIFIILIFLHVLIIRKMENNNQCSMLRVPCYVFHVTCYAILYSLLRFSLELLRIDETPVFAGLRWPQIASLVIIGACLIILLKNKKRYDNINITLT